MSMIGCDDCGHFFVAHHGNCKYCPACKEARAYKPKPREIENCLVCGISILDKGWTAKYCDECAEKVKTAKSGVRHKLDGNEKARLVTKYAIKVGFLPPPVALYCVDCKGNGRIKKAECYDHRDYSKPLEVDPVCLSCNASRGAGIPFKAPLAQDS